MLDSLEAIQQMAAKFAYDREWQRYQSPKNLAMALSVEAAELQELFQWLTEQESRELDDTLRAAAADEIADILLYLLRIADELNIDVFQAVENKARKNAAKYPVDKVKGSPRKYTYYQQDD